MGCLFEIGLIFGVFLEFGCKFGVLMLYCDVVLGLLC